MGVKTPLTLSQLQQLFPLYRFVKISPTKNGVSDTTYRVYTQTGEGYILKMYEKATQKEIQEDAKRLELFALSGLDVPTLVSSTKGWYLYTMLTGESPKKTTPSLLHALARFLGEMHRVQKQLFPPENFLQRYSTCKMLKELRGRFFYYYKKLQPLCGFDMECEGFIHGDIFPDNVLVDKNKLSVIDFIDGGCGAFVFDVAVVLLSFNPTNKQLYNKLFLKSYNQKNLQKISLEELEAMREKAQYIYMLVRLNRYDRTLEAKTLLHHYL